MLATELHRKHAQELREMWQGRALAHATGKTAAVLLSVLAHNYDDAMPVLLRVVFPGFKEPALPCLVSAAKIAKTGAIVADMVGRNGKLTKQAVLYRNEAELRGVFRRLADELKLSDDDRVDLFAALQRWIVCDYRLDPTFDPKDPDAKRLVVH